MRVVRELATLVVGGAWILLGALIYVRAFGPEPSGCPQADTLWSSWWFFAPPLLAAAGVAFGRGTVTRAGAALVFALWSFCFCLWFFDAIGAVSCGG